MLVRVTRGGSVPSPPSHARSRHSLSKIKPLARLLGWRNVDSSPSWESIKMRLFGMSVKYTVPSRSTVGPSVKATVVATSMLLPLFDSGASVGENSSGAHAGKSETSRASATVTP